MLGTDVDKKLILLKNTKPMQTGKRLTAALLVAVMLLIFTSGCKNDKQDELPDASNRPDEELHNKDDKTVITIATFFEGAELLNAVADFQDKNPDYTVEMINYWDYQSSAGIDGYTASLAQGIAKLTTEIISGKAPDIIETSRIPVFDYVSAGLLVDLYSYIDADPEFSRDSFITAAFKAEEINGGLYHVFPQFSIHTIVGHPSVLGSETGWTADELETVLNDNPQADLLTDLTMAKTRFFENTLRLNIDKYINFGTGTADFYTQEFIQFLEISKRFPDDMERLDKVSLEAALALISDNAEAVAAGRIILQSYSLITYPASSDFEEIVLNNEFVFKGYPNDYRNAFLIESAGISFGITQNTENKDVAWQFVRTVLDKEWQIAQREYKLLTNMQAHEEQLQYWKEHYSDNNDMYSSLSGFDYLGMMQRKYDLLNSVINSFPDTTGSYLTESLCNHILEAAYDFFYGSISAEQAAKNIQSRVEIYLSERR